MTYLGDIRLGDTIDMKFCMVTTTGAPTTLAGSPVVSAYPANSTTQVTAGITLTVDFDSVTGLNNVRVVATSGNGYTSATNYALVITTGTVGGTSVVGYVVAHFSIENRSAVMPTTAARTLDVSAGGEAGVDWANIGSPTTAQNLSATNIDVDQVVASVSGAVASVTGLTAADVGAIKTKTDFLPSATAGAAGGVFIAGTNAATAITTALTANQIGNVTGNLSGSVGSVTGAVGSVTGAVGSVTGAVGSVTGAVGSVAAGGITAASIATNAVDADALAADAITEIAAGVFARAFSSAYGSLTFDEIAKVCVAALAAKCSGMGTSTGTFRNLADSGNVIVATIDASGNRTAVTLTP